MRVGAFITVAIALIGQAVAQFKLGDPAYSGAGCPAGLVQLVQPPDGQSLSMVFSQLNAETSSSARFVRSACNVAIPVSMLPGVKLAIWYGEYHVSVSVPGNDGSGAQFTTQFFFAGSTSQTTTVKWDQPTSDDVVVIDRTSPIAWSKCGGSSVLRVDAAITASKRLLTAPDVKINITSDDDFTWGFRYYFGLQSCQ
ncbi:TPA: hypothetical protein N0F65_008371 [Lagenidium giganteum]|uniref:DUF4360 domain-containing protein n=1 Tax=Lagenidium giganteum TaxID=4803 RepID=A0AAV2Z0R7_9STRA|nr:TPA: hypothetical protein N0F65_008371 [Lagenidium giganteum]